MDKLGGFKNATLPERRFLAIAAISTFPIEAVQAELVEDDRFRVQLLEDGMSFMQSLIDYF